MTSNTKTFELSEQELDTAQGGIALLLPAVQAAREAARKSDTSTSTITDGTSNTFMIGETSNF